jgi:hypothetical protein
LLPAARMGASSRASLRSWCRAGRGVRARGSVRLAIRGHEDGVTCSCGIVRRIVPAPVVCPVFRPWRWAAVGRAPGAVRRWGDPRTVRRGLVLVKPETTRCSGPRVVRIATCRVRPRPHTVARRPRKRGQVSTLASRSSTFRAPSSTSPARSSTADRGLSTAERLVVLRTCVLFYAPARGVAHRCHLAIQRCGASYSGSVGSYLASQSADVSYRPAATSKVAGQRPGVCWARRNEPTT